jgi:hypothetical protein
MNANNNSVERLRDTMEGDNILDNVKWWGSQSPWQINNRAICKLGFGIHVQLTTHNAKRKSHHV